MICFLTCIKFKIELKKLVHQIFWKIRWIWTLCLHKVVFICFEWWVSSDNTKIGSIVPMWDSHVQKLKCCTMFWYWWFVKTFWNLALKCLSYLQCSTFVSRSLNIFVCMDLINIHVYNYKCTYLALSVNLPVLRTFSPSFPPTHTLCTKNLTSTTLNQTLQYSAFREKMPITAVFKCVCPATLASESSLMIIYLCQKFPEVTAIKSSTPAMWTL